MIISARKENVLARPEELKTGLAPTPQGPWLSDWRSGGKTNTW